MSITLKSLSYFTDHIQSKGYMMHVAANQLKLQQNTFFGFKRNVRMSSDRKPWTSWYVELHSTSVFELNFILVSCPSIDENTIDPICEDISLIKQQRENEEQLIIIYDTIVIPAPIIHDVNFISSKINVDSFPKNCYLSVRELQNNFHFDESINYSEFKGLTTKFTEFSSVIKFASDIKTHRQKFIEPLIGKHREEAEKMIESQKEDLKYKYLRIIDHNCIVTCDHISSRLNVYLDENQIVQSVNFG